MQWKVVIAEGELSLLPWEGSTWAAQGGFSPKMQNCSWNKNHRRYRKPLQPLFLSKARFCVSPQRGPQAAVSVCPPSTQKSCPLPLHLTSQLPPSPCTRHGPCFPGGTWQGRTGHWAHCVVPILLLSGDGRCHRDGC